MLREMTAALRQPPDRITTKYGETVKPLIGRVPPLAARLGPLCHATA